jgi:hypothetical protein
MLMISKKQLISRMLLISRIPGIVKGHRNNKILTIVLPNKEWSRRRVPGKEDNRAGVSQKQKLWLYSKDR